MKKPPVRYPGPRDCIMPVGYVREHESNGGDSKSIVAKLMELQSPKVEGSREIILKGIGERKGLDNDLSPSEKSIL